MNKQQLISKLDAIRYDDITKTNKLILELMREIKESDDQMAASVMESYKRWKIYQDADQSTEEKNIEYLAIGYEQELSPDPLWDIFRMIRDN